MLGPWVVYAIAIGAVIMAMAAMIERGARWRGWPARWIWLLAIVSTVALPIVLNIARRPRMVNEFATAEAPRALLESPLVTIAGPGLSLDQSILLLWGFASLLLFVRVGAGALILHHRRGAWEPAELDGRPVLIADDLGPAVLGWVRLDTVIPRWAFGLDPASREMMLAHEAEHVGSGDPYLRTVALAALVAMPWNPAIWYGLRRLRLAVEIDCDARLLRRGLDPRRYASFLLLVGERMSATPFAWVTALAGPRSSLEVRVRAMMTPFRPRRPRVIAAGLTLAIATLIAIACGAPVPTSVLPATRAAEDANNPAWSPDSPIPLKGVQVACGLEPAACVEAPTRRYPGDRSAGTRDTVELLYRGRLNIAADSIHFECEIRSDCHGFIAEGRSNDTIFIYREAPTTEKRKPVEESSVALGQVNLFDFQLVAKPLVMGIVEERPEVCTPAQVVARRRGQRGETHYWPRCTEP